MNRLNIELLNIKYINYKEMIIEIYDKDYKLIEDNKTIYDIEILSYKGLNKLKSNLFEYKFVILFIVISLVAIFILSNMIFKIEVITNDLKMEKKIVRFLNSEGIKKYHLKKNFNELKKIKKKLRKKYKNEIEWIEIENLGTKYIVRYEPRIISNIKKDNKYQSIVAKKDAIIYDMNVKSGQIIKNRNDYVKKGDVIVSGYIYLNEEIKDTKKAEGTVYGETWYKLKITYPLNYYNKEKTNDKKNVITINFLSKEIQLFNFNKYKNYDKKNKTIIKNSLLPIKINFQTQQKVKIEKEKNTKEEAIKKAVDYAVNNIKKKLKENEYVKDYKIISNTSDDKNVAVEIFISVVENITDYLEISKYENKEEDKIE